MRRFAILLPLALVGCGDPPMKNDAIIAEIAKCKAAGLDAVEQKENVFSQPWVTTRVQCQQPYKPR